MLKVLTLLVFCCQLSFAVRPDSLQADPAELKVLFERTWQIKQDLELLRLELGKPKFKEPPISVTKAEPRELYYLARTLYKKANRFCFETVRKQSKALSDPPATIGADAVIEVLDKVSDHFEAMKRHFNIRRQMELPRPPEEVNSARVFKVILEANRQINLILERKFSPSDVFEEVTKSTHYAGLLLLTFKDTQSAMPLEPQFIARKFPSDVFGRLLQCFDIVCGFAALSGINLLSVEAKPNYHIEPSDVYDMASLIEAELAYICKMKGIHEVPISFYPGKKIPAQVYQRAGLLMRQLELLHEKVEENPLWLK